MPSETAMNRFQILPFLFACMLVIPACGDDTSEPNVNDGSADASTTDTGNGGVDTIDTPDADSCEVPCTSTQECAATGGVCVDGCCEASTGGPDAGSDTSTGTPCGDIDFLGECDGDIVRWCDNGSLAEINCASEFVPGLPASCEFISDDLGFYCALPPTSECVTVNANNQPVPLLCFGTEPACELRGDTTACVENVGTCVQEGFATQCFGDFLATGCNIVQPIGIQCTNFGGTCDTDACVGIGEGEECDADQLQCGAGLVCEGATATALGTCVSDGTVQPTCDDGEQNGDEEGVDCGGSCPDACTPPEPTCDDGEQNGDEEGVDCGGSCPDACDF
jgi:hypothetical protein